MIMNIKKFYVIVFKSNATEQCNGVKKQDTLLTADRRRSRFMN